MNPASFFGWSAAGLMLLTFSCHDARWLRSLAICANVAFIAYGLAARLHPVAALHLISLPINVYRLRCAVKAFALTHAANGTRREITTDTHIDKPARGQKRRSDSVSFRFARRHGARRSRAKNS